MRWNPKRLLPEPGRTWTVLKLAGPVMLAMLTQTFINLFDTIVIGFLPREYSISGQAALGYSVILHWLIGGFVSAISVGTQAMAARRLGEGDRPGAGKVLFNSAVIALVAGTVVTILAAIFARPMFRMLTSNEQILAQGVPYCRARFLGILAMVGTLSFKAFFDGIGKTHYHLMASVVMNGVNVLLCWLLVFGMFGFPRLNVLGAGVAALIASYVGLGLMIGWALQAKYRLEFRIFRRENFDRSVIWKIVKLSVPSGLATVFVMTGFLLFFKIVGILDKAAADSAGIDGARIPWLHAILPNGMSRDAFVELVRTQPPVLGAATKVIIDILSLSFMTCMGLGVATATLVSQNLGRGKPEESEAFAWTSVKMAAMFTGLMGVAAALFPDAFMGLFTHDEEVIEAGRLSLRLVGAVEFLLGFGMVLAQALFGAGNTRFVMFAEMAMHFGCLVPLSYVLGVVAGLGLEGVWLSAVVYVILLAMIMTWKFRSGTWKQIRL